MSRQRGFTLIEMAFVIAIVGLMVGGGLIAFGPIVEQANINKTNTSLDQIEAALTLFAIRNNRLPCPADGSLSNTSATYGQEQTAPTGGGNCPGTLTNSVVPWRTLGLDANYSVDGWSRRISYFPSNGAVAGADTLVDASTGAGAACAADSTGANCTLCLSRTIGATSQSTRATICDIATAGLTPSYPYGNYIPVYSIDTTTNLFGTELTQANAVAAPSTATGATGTTGNGLRAAYVLISHGKSGWYGWTTSGTQFVPPSTSYTLKKYNSGVAANLANGLGFVQGTAQYVSQTSNTAYFDDIVRWRSPAFLIQQCGSSACGNP